MKFKYVLKLSFSNLSRRKVKTIISILLMTVALTIFILTLSFSSSLNQYFNSNLENNVGCRSLFVDYDYKLYSEAKIIDIVSKYQHVSAAIPQGDLGQQISADQFVGQFQIPNIGSNNGEIMIKGGNNKTVPKIIAGRNFKDDETNVAIVPDKFIPDSRIESAKGIKADSILDGKSLLGKEVIGKYNSNNSSKTYKFTIVGVFDTDKSNENGDIFYVPYKDIDIIYRAQNESINNTTEGGYPIEIVVDNYKNVDAVMNELYKNNMVPSVKVRLNTQLPLYINLLGGGLSVVIFIVVLINIAMTTINSIKDRTSEIGMLKAIGYRNKIVLLMLNLETIIIGIIGFVIAMGISSGALIYVSRRIKDQNPTDNMHVSANLIAVLIALVLSVIVPVIACISSSIRTMKIQPSYAMKE
ncbi:ABC transporter permease [Inconstantimicrobium mannanitabidum]|uniref:Uncharacterized protein n=1 Tax=Inconstantimicrobium mannanitabidum TaxID=1604901 RepID=A0ACB5RBT6_9CLOT|nr:FtsX-like permease family protein [Clostridium sp. TW13]GKX66708.1 hypothetical protein rsdtw13_19660 [Clostridium sp. TW13]